MKTALFFAIIRLARCFAAQDVHLYAGGIVSDGTTDVCGDPVPTKAMHDQPDMIIKYLEQQPYNVKVDQRINQHPWIKAVEDGKMTKEGMQNFVVQMSYATEHCTRVAAAGIHRFGSIYGVSEEREFFGRMLLMHKDKLLALVSLGQKFDIKNADELLRNDPDPDAQHMINAAEDVIAHGQHSSELVAPLAVVVPRYMDANKRIKNALMTNAAYKAWNLTPDDLHFFDDTGDFKDMRTMVDPILRNAVDHQITICQLRRRLNQMDNGQMRLWDTLWDQMNPSQSEFA